MTIIKGKMTSMRKIVFYIFILIATISMAATYTPDNLPIPYLQDKTQYVSNPDGILSQTAVDSLNLWLGQMETAHGVQTVLAVVEHVEGGDAYDFCMALGRKYKIGSKEQNTGLIILLATGDRSYYILTGRGLEGTLPDAICKRIENRQMLPALREGDWDEAMLNAVRAITKYVDGDDSLVGSSDFEHIGNHVSHFVFSLFLVFGILIIMLAILYDRRKKSYCPSCHQYKMKRISRRTTTNHLLGKRAHHDTYRCTHCHFTKERHWDEDMHHNGGAAAAGGILGSSFFHGGGGFSGGHFGGHFGGGSFGGGGAGGRF